MVGSRPGCNGRWGSWDDAVAKNLEASFYNHAFCPIGPKGPAFCIWEVLEDRSAEEFQEFVCGPIVVNFGLDAQMNICRELDINLAGNTPYPRKFWIIQVATFHLTRNGWHDQTIKQQSIFFVVIVTLYSHEQITAMSSNNKIPQRSDPFGNSIHWIVSLAKALKWFKTSILRKSRSQKLLPHIQIINQEIQTTGSSRNPCIKPTNDFIAGDSLLACDRTVGL